ncbi:MAG: hypothetical protein JST47_02165 [Bacteroidetes bacterium]|nr:hypothetical protein [Bacteroidota bacterium]MBS1975467.1 hypothetical protein [Bacteroidota bacterium]
MNKEASQTDIGHPSGPIRVLAHLFSFIFHPGLIASYVMYFLIFIHPFEFSGLDQKLKVYRFITVFFSTTLLPAFSTFLLLQLKLGVQSIYLRTMKERIIPYALAMIFYWWAWNVYKHLSDSHPASIHFLLGAFLAVCGAWFCNIYFKISMHAISAGGLVMFFLLFSFAGDFASGLYLSVAIAIAGIVCTSRMIISGHTPVEIYSGLFIGALAQFIGWHL